MTATLFISRGDGDPVQIEVEYEIEPEQRETRWEPGWPAQCEIIGAVIVATGEEITLTKEETAEAIEAVWEFLKDDFEEPEHDEHLFI